MFIRIATPADIPALMALASLSESAGLWSVEQYQDIFTGSISRRTVLVVEGQSLVQAFLVASFLDNECEIENLVVADGHRRQGLAKQLLDEFLAISRRRGAKAIFLEVRESNVPARRLYEKYGFVENGRRPRYYQQPEEDGVLYQLNLL